MDQIQKDLDMKINPKDSQKISEKIKNLVEGEKLLNDFVI